MLIRFRVDQRTAESNLPNIRRMESVVCTRFTVCSGEQWKAEDSLIYASNVLAYFSSRMGHSVEADHVFIAFIRPHERGYSNPYPSEDCQNAETKLPPAISTHPILVGNFIRNGTSRNLPPASRPSHRSRESGGLQMARQL
jgi:hypothetical protein